MDIAKDMKFKSYALISTFNKKNIISLCKIFNKIGIGIISTGSTANYIRNIGYECKTVSSFTKFKEILDGRVKTLHPKIYASILFKRKNKKQNLSFSSLNFPKIDYVIVNLYPFQEIIKNTKNSQKCIDMIDIGGPALLRSAAKNFSSVTTICDFDDYSDFIKNIKNNQGKTSINFRRKMATKAFELTSEYDYFISMWFSKNKSNEISFNNFHTKNLRYGENPNQKSKIYYGNKINDITNYKIQGKKLSYNNLLDIDSAINFIRDFSEPTCSIFKHNNPCGAASKKNIISAFKLALSSDIKSSFGGVVIFNRIVGKDLSKIIISNYFEIILATRFTNDAKKILKSKKKLDFDRNKRNFKHK